MQTVTREAGHLKLAGRNYFVSTFIADMGHTDVTQETGVTTVQSLSVSGATISLARIPPSVGLYTALCTLLLIHISNNIMSSVTTTATAVSGRGRAVCLSVNKD